jgi:hypothetical protein
MKIRLMEKDIKPKVINYDVTAINGISFTSTDARKVMLPFNDDAFSRAVEPLLEQMFDDDWDILKDALVIEYFIDLNVQPVNIIDRFFRGITSVLPVRATIFIRITCLETGDVITRQLITDHSEKESDSIAAMYLINGCQGFNAKRQQDVTARLLKWFNHTDSNGRNKAQIISDVISITLWQMGVTGNGASQPA